MTHLDGIVQLLHAGGIDSVLIGGIAAAAHGSLRVTQDVDIVYSRTADNLKRIAAALAPVIRTSAGHLRACLSDLRCQR